MTTLSWVPRINVTKTVSITPIISTPAYAAGDQLGAIMELTNVIRQDRQSGGMSAASATGEGYSELAGITILDADKQDSIFDIWFFNTSPTVTSVDNGAFSMSDANQKLQCIGTVICTTSNGGYSDAALNSTGEWSNINKILRVPQTASVPTSVFAIAIARGTPTYTTTTALQFQFHFYVD